MWSKRLADKEREAEVSVALQWTPEQVAEWIADIGYPQYKECITSNFINGRKLIFLNMSALPRIGITDYDHMKDIAKELRTLLRIEEPNYRRSISLPAHEIMASYLEKKCQTGARADALTYVRFYKQATHPVTGSKRAKSS